MRRRLASHRGRGRARRVQAHPPNAYPLVALSCEQRQVTQIQSDELPAEEIIGGVPIWAVDLYSREVRAASRVFSKVMRPPLDECGAPSDRRAHRVSSGTSSSGSRAGSSTVDCGGRSGTSCAVKTDVECSGPDCPDAAEILELMRDNIPLLNEVRAAVMGAPRG